jgi:hypothetical protein
MKTLSINFKSAFGLSLVLIVLSGCYDKFDPESYKPVFTISGYSAVDEIQPDNLVAYWSFDGDLNETLSGTAPTNHETSVVNGFQGQGVSFNATSPSWLLFEPTEAITSLESFTVSFWLNPTFVDTNADNKNDGLLGLLAISNPGRFWGNLEWFVDNNSNADAAILKVIVTHNNETETDILVDKYKGLFGTWTNHTLTYDAATSTLTYYISGSQRATKVVPWTGPVSFVNSGPMVFGTAQFQTSPSLTNHGPEDWASHLTGIIDEVRIYDKALSQTDINALVVLQGKGK